MLQLETIKRSENTQFLQMGYQQFRRKIFGENISAAYFSSYFSLSQNSFRYQFLHVKESQFYVLCFLACSKPSGHAFACSGVRVNSASLVPCPIAYSSVSPELRAIVPCVLLPKETVEFNS